MDEASLTNRTASSYATMTVEFQWEWGPLVLSTMAMDKHDSQCSQSTSTI